MKITDVQACVIGRPEPHSGGCVWTFVRVYTDEGIVGTGECNSAGAGCSGFATKEAILAMKPLLLDKDPTNIGPLYETLRRRGRYGGTTGAPLTPILSWQDRRAAELIQASEDVLTLLSQEGIYMDDLVPDRARPEIWRRFAEGQRGRPIATLGGIRDRSSLALTAARMRNDPIFRDAVHHFLRKFDQIFTEFEEGASDEEITDAAAAGQRCDVG